MEMLFGHRQQTAAKSEVFSFSTKFHSFVGGENLSNVFSLQGGAVGERSPVPFNRKGWSCVRIKVGGVQLLFVWWLHGAPLVLAARWRWLVVGVGCGAPGASLCLIRAVHMIKS